jgi:hypothetical protein
MLLGLILLVKVTFQREQSGAGDYEDEPGDSAEGLQDRISRLRNQDLERILRATALAMGVLVVLGARAAGVSIPSVLGESVSLVSPVRFAVASVAVPAAVGVVTAWFFTRVLKKDARLALRIMIFVGALMFTLFVDVYAAAVGENGLGVGAAFVPNIAFVAALGIYAITRVEVPTDPAGLQRKQSVGDE